MQSKKRLGDFFCQRKEKGRPGLPLFSVTMNNGLVHRDTLERKTDSNLAEDEHLLIKEGDIAYNMMCMWQGASGLADQDGMVSPAYVVVAPTDKVDPMFASYWFKSPRMIYLFWAYSYGITGDRLRLYPKDFSKVPAILRSWDRAIEQTEKLIAAKRRLMQGLMQQLLTGRRRFPEFTTKHPSRETKYGLIPAGWDVVHFGDVATINERTLPESTDPEHSSYYVDLSAVNEGLVVLLQDKIRFADAPSRARRLASRGDIVMATVRPNLRGFALPNFDLSEFVFSTGFAIISPQCGGDSDFLYHSTFRDDCTADSRHDRGLELSGDQWKRRWASSIALPRQPRGKVKNRTGINLHVKRASSVRKLLRPPTRTKARPDAETVNRQSSCEDNRRHIMKRDMDLIRTVLLQVTERRHAIALGFNPRSTGKWRAGSALPHTVAPRLRLYASRKPRTKVRGYRMPSLRD